MIDVDSRVEDADFQPCPGVFDASHGAPGCGSADDFAGFVHQQLEAAGAVDPLHAGQPLELFCLLFRRTYEHRVQGVTNRTRDFDPERADSSLDRFLGGFGLAG